MHFNLAEYKLDPGDAVRVPRDVHDVAVRLRHGAARAARPRADRIRRRGATGRRLLALLLPLQRAAERATG